MKSGPRRKMASKRSNPSRGLSARIATVTTVVLILASFYVFFFTGVFSLKEVEMLGGSNLLPDSLKAVTAGLIGRNLFTVSLAGARERLMKCSDVRDVEFQRKPFHRLECRLIEREPAAMIALDGAVFEVDGEGVIMRGSGKNLDIDLPVVTGVGPVEVETPAGRQKLAKAMEVLRLLKTHGFSPAEQLSEIHLEEEEIILVWMGTGTLIRMGVSDYEEKARKLRAVYGSLCEDGDFPDLIDLRFDRQVIVR